MAIKNKKIVTKIKYSMILISTIFILYSCDRFPFAEPARNCHTMTIENKTSKYLTIVFMDSINSGEPYQTNVSIKPDNYYIEEMVANPAIDKDAFFVLSNNMKKRQYVFMVIICN